MFTKSEIRFLQNTSKKDKVNIFIVCTYMLNFTTKNRLCPSKSKLSVVKLDRLDYFIAAVVPMDNNDKVTNDFSKNTPDIGKYIMG